MKYKRKLIPVNLMNIPAMESWLSDMAAEGFYLHSLGPYVAKFTEGDVPQIGTIKYNFKLN